MPRRTERKKTLDLLKKVIPQLQIGTMLHAMASSAHAVTLNESGDDDNMDDAWINRQAALSFMLTLQNTINALSNLQSTIDGSRYMTERKVWRGVRQVREAEMEYFFGMDVDWFKNAVSRIVPPRTLVMFRCRC